MADCNRHTAAAGEGPDCSRRHTAEVAGYSRMMMGGGRPAAEGIRCILGVVVGSNCCPGNAAGVDHRIRRDNRTTYQVRGEFRPWMWCVSDASSMLTLLQRSAGRRRRRREGNEQTGESFRWEVARSGGGLKLFLGSG